MISKSLFFRSLSYSLILSGCILGILEFSNSPIAYSQSRYCNIGSLPEHPGNYKLRGSLFLKKELFQDALNCFEIALQDDRGQQDPELWNNHGLALAGMKRFEEALISYDRALQIKPGAKFVDRVQPLAQQEDYYLWWFNRGTALVDLQRYREAITDLDKALKIKSDSGFVWFFRGLALFRLERYEEARISYRRSVLLSPNSPYNIKAKHLFSVQDYVVYYGEAEAKSRLGRYKDAIQAFDRGQSIRRNNPNLKFFLSNVDESTYENYIEGIRSLEQGNYTQALNAFDRIIASNPNHANVWDVKADTLVALKRYPEAIKAFDRVTTIEPDEYPSWYKKGNALREMNRDAEALQSYQKAIILSGGGFAEFWHNQGLILQKQANYEMAINVYKRSLKLGTFWGGVDRIDTQYGLAASLYAVGRYRESSIELEKVLKENPQYKQGLELRKLLQQI
ncbi:MAG: tetratricopeptide repeat protein [Pseudanabaena sp. M135S2SP2A07QC]|nr:tetratricopeptide repeat protein [Pseudanabaena sp. M176S2SP2A07QC]MCA6540398.1 tetratricopeptide repeat protein [Pseudanabaena sp. M037S2SP2A07QC]MCA6542509.1 tetratricopeptide repeat protein [Pseudanabaena sp. M074S1SP2A07QC]MCA6554649.1 tetratricopeptide repeat protein [Pseudanabaena sp. M135S2SP2A07QC]MCA6556634.1 tetratricopeptide repeat protein [Pseudanabaena sp. M114S2SP2A07QC]MCA6566549.1 tetratricopeptide repeat protein [Pseudanabaena sp. M151S2SP2A07QC]MCA6570350.1 tetratricopept